MTATQHDDNRLTDTDRKVIRSRLTGTVADWRPATPPKWSDVGTLERIAAHSIGCSLYDLRDSELTEVRAMCADVLGLTETTGRQ